MLQIIIYRNKEEKILGYKAEGHCGFEDEGKDIVCSGASTLLQVAVLGLSKYCNIKPQVEISKGNLTCIVSEIKDISEERDSQVILETMLLGLREIEKQYPEYITVEEKER
jgi:uncharacterized protein